MDGRTTVVMATRNRRQRVLETLAHLLALPEQPPIIVVDNASTDGTAEAVLAAHPDVDVVVLPENRAASGRTAGVWLATTPYVAFSDDDSWWAPGALARAADVLDRSADVAVVAARVLVGDAGDVDPVCRAMAASPLGANHDGAGRPVLGFLACGAVVRRDAYLDVGGFDELLGIMGEEEVLALDLASAGWALRYVDDVVAFHHPGRTGDRRGRRRRQIRNAVLTAWMRRPLTSALRQTANWVAASRRDAAVRAGLLDAARSLPVALRRRRVIPVAVERQVELLEAGPA